MWWIAFGSETYKIFFYNPVSDIELNRRMIIEAHPKCSLHFDDATIYVRRSKLNSICNNPRTNKFLLISDENPKLGDSAFQEEILGGYQNK